MPDTEATHCIIYMKGPEYANPQQKIDSSGAGGRGGNEE